MKKINIYLIVNAILLVAIGAICIVKPGEALLTFIEIIGILILISGCFGLIFGLKANKILPNAGTTVVLSIFQMLVGVLFIWKGLVAEEIIFAIFAIWMLFEGLSLGVLSFDYKRAGYPKWWVMLLLGAVSLVLGILVLHNPGPVSTFVGILLGLGILANGVERFVALIALNNIQRTLRDIKESATALPIDDQQESE